VNATQILTRTSRQSGDLVEVIRTNKKVAVEDPLGVDGAADESTWSERAESTADDAEGEEVARLL
jgi:hypothetical protein